jgi:putative CocE/NonD family hydrolase
VRAVLAVILLSSAVLAGCSTHPAGHAALPALPGPTAALSSYLHDLSQPIPGVSYTDAMTYTKVKLEHYRITTAGEIQLDTYVFRPDVSDPVPIVLTITPYYGGGLPQSNPALGTPVTALAKDLVPRGYAVGWSSVRGTGDSGGCFSQGGPQEAADNAAVVEYLAAQPWSNGAVGMIGVSYDGTTPQETWVQAPPHLKTVVPIAGISDLYKYNFVNGVPINVQGFGFNTYYWGIVGLGPAGLEGGVGATDPASYATAVAGEACQDQTNVQEGGVSSTVDGNKDAYWQSRDFLARLKADPDRPRAPVFYIHGLQDYNVKDHNMDGWIQAIQATGVPFKAMLGQWQHAWPDNTFDTPDCKPTAAEPIAACRADWWEQVLVAWFDQTLKGRDTGILLAPAVQVQDDDGTWRHEATWPPTDVQPWVLHPDASGNLGTGAGSGTATYFDNYGDLQAASPVAPPAGLPTNAGPTQVAFVSSPVAADTHISGIPVFHGNVTAGGDKAALVLTLAERYANGTERSINFAAQSLNHVADPAIGKASVAGLRQDVRVDFLPSDDVLHKGSSLILYAAGNTVGSDRGGTIGVQPISSGSTIALDLAGASLWLPVDTTITVESPPPVDK